ncbi:MAG: PspC domain-containing protein [Chitinophagaceae bacterium]|nr:PspC domain-containing protein [Chitinophagaceae bacterium]
MKKVININFQGRVIPIEETAYEVLKQYVESLRRYFANEEGKDEIINDIENRIAELFDEKLKKGAPCISDDNVYAVMDSMGRPEDFEQEETAYSTGKTTGPDTGKVNSSQASDTGTPPRRLFRAENDKVLGGVCAGIANYLKVDPAIVRIIFALIAFGGFGFGFLLYIILWIILPSKPLRSNGRKRLYRDPDNKMIGGVAGGLAAYFNIDTWIPRLVFLLPFLISLLPNIFSGFWWHWRGPLVAFGGLGGTFFIAYIILWIVLPRAVTASEKLEMRGEKIDLESIKNTVQEELQNIKGRGEKLGAELKEKSKEMGQEISNALHQKTQAFAAEAGPFAKKAGTGIGNAIGVLFKAFFLFIAGIVAFALLLALIALLYSGIGIYPLKNFLLEGLWENFLVWSVLTMFIGVPIIAFIVWITRRMMRIKSGNPYLGYTFGSLWIIGLISLFVLIGMVTRNFRSNTNITQQVDITQPSTGNLVIKVSDNKIKYYSSEWFDWDFPLLSMNKDSMLLNTVQVKVIKSSDSSYHIQTVKLSRGNTPAIAEKNAANIPFPVDQNDSLVILPRGFPITNKDKFRNQKVMLIVEVPVGKKIMMDKSVNWFDWFDIEVGRKRRWNTDWNERWDNAYSWRSNVQYIMTTEGLERTDKKDEDKINLKGGKLKLKANKNEVELEFDGATDGETGIHLNSRKKDSFLIEKGKKPAPPKTPALPPAPVRERKASVPDNNGKEENVVKAGTTEDLHSPFRFLSSR